MKARWDERDREVMVDKPLPFAAEDIELIRLALARSKAAQVR
jgi:hypothetical protein